MKHYLLFTRRLLLLCLLTGWCFSSFAQSIKGKIFDSKTGEPLVGATVKIAQGEFKQFTTARLDGSFLFKDLRAGDYKVTANYVGYQDSPAIDVTVKNAGEVTVPNIYLTDLNTTLTEVSVSAQGSKTSDQSARNLEKSAASVENILSQNTIQLLPDVTVGNALQRVSGVTVQRTNTGEGRYAIIRGMDQRYNSTLVNGIKIPSPDDRYRFVPMDIFPSDMIERLEVIKALTPGMEADATGGTMNLVMKSAPDRFILDANVSAGFSTLFSNNRPFTSFSSAGINHQSPAQINGNSYQATYADFNNSAITSDKSLSSPLSSTAGLTIGDRFLNGKLGVILSASYQDIYRGSNSEALIPNAQPTVVPSPNSPQFSDAIDRQYSTQSQRIGIHNKIDFIIDKNNKLSLYNLYLHTNEYESRLTSDTLGLGLNSTSAAKQVTIENRSTFIQQNIYNSTLQGDHTLSDKLKFNWSAVYSLAKRDEPDRTEFDYDSNPTYNSSGQLVSDVDNNTVLQHHWESNSDQDLAAYANLIYHQKIAKRDVELSVGGLFRHKTRSAYYITYNLTGGNTVYDNNFTSIPFAFASPTDGIGSYNSALTNDYTATENINAEYIQAKFRLFPRLEVLGGVRVENTDQSYNTQEPYNFSLRSGIIQYTDVLPSVHFKYELTDDQNLRLSYFESISRPGFGEVVPYRIDGEYYTETGNPYLKHSTADNYDFRYELFPGGADQLLLGAFYKDIQNPIEYFVVRESGPSAQDIQPQNAAGGAINYGLEAQVTKYFGIFGISGNYTYTHSSITTNKLLYYNDQTLGLQQKVVQQTRPLQGQADNIGNISALLKDQKIGLDMEVAFVYTGETIAQVSQYYNLDYYSHPFSQLDFSFEKTIVKRLSFYGKVNNLTNSIAKIYLKYPHASIEPREQEFLGEQDIATETRVQSDMYKISFLGGLRYKF